MQGLPDVKDVQQLQPTESAAPKLVITVADPAAQNPAIVRTLIEGGGEIQFVNELKHRLEDVPEPDQ